MKIFFRLLLAHLLTDFTLQTNFIAKWKRKNFTGVIVHSFIFFILGLILTWEDINKIWFDYPFQLSGFVCLIILFILHIIEDEYRAYTVRNYHIQDNLLFFIWDQFIHITFLYIFSPYRELSFEKWVIILCILIVGTHVLSVILFYFDTLFCKEEIAYKNFQNKYIYIFLRLLIILTFLLPNYLIFISFLFIPVNFFIYRRLKKLSLVSFWINLIMPYFLGFIIYIINN
ncbi:MAG: DUF3307 domain-containing protein [Endomicrobiia bacterium]